MKKSFAQHQKNLFDQLDLHEQGRLDEDPYCTSVRLYVAIHLRKVKPVQAVIADRNARAAYRPTDIARWF